MGALVRPGIQMTATSARKETVAFVGAGSIGVAWATALGELSKPS